MQFGNDEERGSPPKGFNTASGMDCMQLANLMEREMPPAFQYRKRYGLHAILSPGSLGNSEPRSRFSDTDPLFAFFPKVRGTFLSRKVLRKGLEASHSKGTFVHERNLILMAFSLNFRASLEQSIPRRMGTCQQVSENFSSAVQAKIRRERFRRRFRWISFFWHGTPSFPGGAVRFFGEIAGKGFCRQAAGKRENRRCKPLKCKRFVTKSLFCTII